MAVRGATILCLCFSISLISVSSASFAGYRDPQTLLDKAASADQDLRAHPEKLKFRHYIQRVIRRWNWAGRASKRQPELHRAALRGEASAWALMAHWSGRNDDRVQADKLAAKLASMPGLVVTSALTDKDAPLAASDEPSVLAGDSASLSKADVVPEVIVEASSPEVVGPALATAVPEIVVAQVASPEASVVEPSPAQIVAEVESLAAGLRAALAGIGAHDAAHEAASEVQEFVIEEPQITESAQWRASTRRAAKPRQVSLLKIRRVIVDAGHGGKDPGAVGPGGVREADVNLSIAKRLGAELSEKYGLEVIYTRSTDHFVSLKARTQIANQHEADLFISVHANAHRNRKVHGIETYYLNTTSNRYARRLARRENLLATHSEDQGLEPGVGMQTEDVGSLPEGKLGQDLRLILADLAMRSAAVESKRLAGYVQTAMVSGLRRQKETVKDLGVKHALFYVLLGARMPSVLVETGFISHAQESLRLADAAYQQHVAQSIARGVMRFAAERADVARRNAPNKPSEGPVVASLPMTITVN